MNDNWGSVARFGAFIVGSEVVPEAEWWAMAPPGISIHAARVTARAPWATWDAERRNVTLAPDVAHGASQFAMLRPHAIVLAHTSSSVLGGDGWDDAVCAALRPLVDAATAVTTNGLDCFAALRSLSITRPFLVLPPWFDDTFRQAAIAHLSRAGFSPAQSLIHTPDAKWQGKRADELYRAFMHIEQRVDLLLDQIVAACPDTADGIFIAGTGFRCVGIIDALEQRLGRPVITANQASLWNCMRLARCARPIANYGQLLRDGQSP